MQIQQLRYFATLVEQQSYTIAARECLITQPALSQQIKSLEAAMGVTLVTRSGRSFAVTAAGQFLYKNVIKLIQDIDELKLKVKRVGDNIGMTFRIGVLSSMDCVRVEEVFAKEMLERSGLELIMQKGSHDELWNIFQNGDIKAFISEESRIGESPLINKIRLFATKLSLELALPQQINYTGVQKAKVDSRELLNLEHVLFVCPEQYLANELSSLKKLLHLDTIKIEAVSSIEEGRRFILEKPNSGLITDRSLLRGDHCDNLNIKRYELTHKGKAIRRQICCYARRNLEFADIKDIYQIAMEKGTKSYKKKSGIELLAHQNNVL